MRDRRDDEAKLDGMFTISRRQFYNAMADQFAGMVPFANRHVARQMEGHDPGDEDRSFDMYDVRGAR